jgi:DNA-binding GntR family transcriptional regulator
MAADPNLKILTGSISDHIDGAGRNLSAAELAATFGTSPEAIEEAIQQLIARGEIARNPDGTYSSCD